MGEKVYCRHEGEHSLRHLEESRLKMVSRTERAMRGERERKRRKKGKTVSGPREEPREHVVEIAGLHRRKKWGKGAQGFRVGGGGV